ncbi:helix-turn-helix domain-containing protein [Kitasatospora griseola]
MNASDSPARSLADLAGFASDEPLRVKEIARALGVSSDTVEREVRAGRLPSYRVGSGRGTIRVTRQAFRAYLKERGVPIGLAVLTG